jgi:hypothetical protein
MASKVRKFVLWLVALAVLGMAAVFALNSTEWGQLKIADARREVRIALGLPKKWVNDFNVDVAGHRAVACPVDPIVIVTGGQSNASNAYKPVTDTAAVPNGFMFFGGLCYELKTPVLGTSGKQDSLWPALGAAIAAATQRPVVFINGAAGGTQLGDWLDDRSGYLKRLTDNIAGARKLGLEAQWVIWIQGETDAKTRIEPDLYVRQMRELIDRLESRGGIAPRWVLFRSTRCMNRPNNGPEIDRALTAFVDESATDPIIAGPMASDLDDSFRWDTCHFNNLGRDRLVQETMAIIGPLL